MSRETEVEIHAEISVASRVATFGSPHTLPSLLIHSLFSRRHERKTWVVGARRQRRASVVSSSSPSPRSTLLNYFKTLFWRNMTGVDAAQCFTNAYLEVGGKKSRKAKKRRKSPAQVSPTVENTPEVYICLKSRPSKMNRIFVLKLSRVSRQLFRGHCRASRTADGVFLVEIFGPCLWRIVTENDSAHRLVEMDNEWC